MEGRAFAAGERKVFLLCSHVVAGQQLVAILVWHPFGLRRVKVWAVGFNYGRAAPSRDDRFAPEGDMSCFEVRGWKGAVTRLSGLNTKANQASVKTAGACRDIKRAMYLSRRAGLPPPALFSRCWRSAHLQCMPARVQTIPSTAVPRRTVMTDIVRRKIAMTAKSVSTTEAQSTDDSTGICIDNGPA